MLQILVVQFYILPSTDDQKLSIIKLSEQKIKANILLQMVLKK